jgi:hypothetical protein
MFGRKPLADPFGGGQGRDAFVFGYQVNVEPQAWEICRTDFATACVQTLDPAAPTDEGSRLAAAWTAREFLVVLDAAAVQNEQRVSRVRS